MSTMDNTTLLYKLNTTNEKEIKSFIESTFDNVIIRESSYGFSDYCCDWFLDEEYYIDAINYAIDIDQCCIFNAYGDDELSFELFERILNNTKGDCLLENQGHIIFERRNEVITVIDSYDEYPDCSFKNCDELLKIEHVIGFHNEYYFELNFHEDIDILKKQFADNLEHLPMRTKNVTVIDSEMRKNSFAIICDCFSLTIEKDEDIENKYYIWVHLTYSEDQFELKNQYLKDFISDVLNKYELSDKYKKQVDEYGGTCLDYILNHYSHSL